MSDRFVVLRAAQESLDVLGAEYVTASEQLGSFSVDKLQELILWLWVEVAKLTDKDRLTKLHEAIRSVTTLRRFILEEQS